MIREVKSVLSLGPERDWKVPVIRTEAAKEEGIGELLEAIDAHGRRIAESGTLAERRARNLRAEVLGIAAARMRGELEARAARDPELGRAAGARRPSRDRPGDGRPRAGRKRPR